MNQESSIKPFGSAKLYIMDEELRSQEHQGYYVSLNNCLLKEHKWFNKCTVTDNPHILDYVKKYRRESTMKERMIGQPPFIFDWMPFHMMTKRSTSKFDDSKESVLVNAEFIDDMFKISETLPNEEFQFAYLYEDKYVLYDVKVLRTVFESDLWKKQHTKNIKCFQPASGEFEWQISYIIPYDLGTICKYKTTKNLRDKIYDAYKRASKSHTQSLEELSKESSIETPNESPKEIRNQISSLI